MPCAVRRASVHPRKERKDVVCWRQVRHFATQPGADTHAPHGCPRLSDEATDAIFTQTPRGLIGNAQRGFFGRAPGHRP